MQVGTLQVKKALILDFDGTIRRSKSGKTFVEGPDDIELIPGVEKWIWRYRELGYLIFGLSNQAGVAHGFKTFYEVHDEFEATYSLFKPSNPFHIVKYCMHDGKGKVEPYNHRSLGRKPDIGLLFEMETDSYKAGYIVDWDNSLFVGDRPEDEECAKRAGIPFRHIDHFLTTTYILNTNNMSKEIKNMPKDFDLNHQWGLFLERCGVSAITMPEDQHREMKRAFFGACGQMLILLRDDLGDYGDKHGDEKAAYVLQNMLDQVGNFWQKEQDKQSGKEN